VDDRHLGWRIGSDGLPEPDYKARVNRQQLPPQFRETGAVIGCRISRFLETGTRINKPVRLVEVTNAEALDIDNFSDWAVAEHLASRLRVVIRADGGPALGLGHIYRSLALAQELARHDLLIVTDRSQPLGATVLAEYPFAHEPVDGAPGFMELLRGLRPDLVVLDQLDTSREYVDAVREHARRIVTFEDLGPGAEAADLLVSDLYENLSVPAERQMQGLANAILAPHFETLAAPRPFRERVERVLVVFGGTDPSRLSERALEALALARFDGEVDLVLGPGLSRPVTLAAYGLKGRVMRNVRYMPELMRCADLALSSAGRTVTELLVCGVPVLCMCQNEKELTHTHAAARFGVVNLGLGELIDPQTVAAHVRRLVQSTELRRVLHARARKELCDRSNSAIIRAMLERLGLGGGAKPGTAPQTNGLRV
jgi:spore coat polysaccharide biosynthesis predicted glycosyltransferase SpsG